jgi:hypothetical protein
MCVYSKREREMQTREHPGDTGGRQRVRKGDEHSRRLFVADKLARQTSQLCVGGSEGKRRDMQALVEVEAAVTSDELDLSGVRRRFCVS